MLISSGEAHHEEAFWVRDWESVKERFSAWLANLDRERRARELGEASPGDSPDWLKGRLPPRIAEIRQEIDQLRREGGELSKITGLLWQTGQTLNEAVRDAFRKLGFRAELTDPAETYDVTVEIEQQRRLLIEVTGIDDVIKKRSNKIAQVLQTSTKIAGDRDRVVLAVNAHRRKPPEARAGLELITPDAADLLVGMKAVIVSTVTLHEIVALSASKPEKAKGRVEELYAAPPGIFV